LHDRVLLLAGAVLAAMPSPVLAVGGIIWERLLKPAQRRMHFFQEWTEADVPEQRDSSEQQDSSYQQVLAILKGLAAEALGAEVAVDTPLMSAGLDSLGAVELKNGVSARFGVTLPATVAFDYPTLEVTLFQQPGINEIYKRDHSHLCMFLQTMARCVAASSAPPKAVVAAVRSSAAPADNAVQEDVGAIVADVLGAPVPPDQPLMQVADARGLQWFVCKK
jgi:acyl carrier protein